MTLDNAIRAQMANLPSLEPEGRGQVMRIRSSDSSRVRVYRTLDGKLVEIGEQRRNMPRELGFESATETKRDLPVPKEWVLEAAHEKEKLNREFAERMAADREKALKVLNDDLAIPNAPRAPISQLPAASPLPRSGE
jgi:hypothetical protein